MIPQLISLLSVAMPYLSCDTSPSHARVIQIAKMVSMGVTQTKDLHTILLQNPNKPQYPKTKGKERNILVVCGDERPTRPYLNKARAEIINNDTRSRKETIMSLRCQHRISHFTKQTTVNRARQSRDQSRCAKQTASENQTTASVFRAGKIPTKNQTKQKRKKGGEWGTVCPKMILWPQKIFARSDLECLYLKRPRKRNPFQIWLVCHFRYQRRGSERNESNRGIQGNEESFSQKAREGSSMVIEDGK